MSNFRVKDFVAEAVKFKKPLEEEAFFVKNKNLERIKYGQALKILQENQANFWSTTLLKPYINSFTSTTAAVILGDDFSSKFQVTPTNLNFGFREVGRSLHLGRSLHSTS